MDMEAPFPNGKTENQLICCSSNDQNGFINSHDAMKGMQHLGKALDENRCDSTFGINSSGPSSGLMATDMSDTEPSALVPDTQTAHLKKDVAEDEIACTDEDSYHRKPNGDLEMLGQDCKASITIKKEARFELRAFQEEKKPSKLFDCRSEKEPIRVKKVRDSEEMEELERERQELIHSQAVKKNPGIATKWWNPPQIKTIEEELDPDQLESHRKYQERKQKKLVSSNVQQELLAQTDVSFIPLLETTTADLVNNTQEKATEGQTQSADDFPIVTASEQARTENELKERNDAGENYGDLTCAKAVVTVLEDPELSSANSSCHNEEIDSGLDDLSVQSQDTPAQELSPNDFCMDNVSDSGASNEATNVFGDFSLPANPQATSPVHGEMGGRTTTQSESSMSPSSPGTSPTEEPIEYHPMVPVQNATLQPCQTTGWELMESQKESLTDPRRYDKVHHEAHLEESIETRNVKSFIQLPPQICDNKPKCPPQVLSPHNLTEQIPVKTSPVSSDTFQPLTIGGGPSHKASEKQEYSYFSKYSEAAELRSTASLTRPRETEVSSGPFRLRSHKQRTLTMIEDDIRAAQEREQELKRHRQTQGLNTSPSHKERAANVPTRLVVTAKTVPGKIQCVASMPLTQDCPNSPTLSDVSSEGSERGQHPKNLMQTLMEDYEIQKVKRKEKMEDNRVLEAMRVTRQKSNMATQWEAGVFTNQEENED